MRRETVTISAIRDIDWKGIGYLFSIVGALLLGAQSAPNPSDPWWYWPALIGGVATSIIGFGVRYMAHLRQRREIEQTKRKAERR